jgi:hypothetical protein
MSTTITPTEQNIEINVNNDVIDINVTNEIVDVNATTQQIDINVAGAYPIPNPVLSVFGRTGVVVATEGDYTLTQLGDVTLTNPSNGQVLKYNGTAWVNSTDADTGITTLNTLTALSQTFATGTSGTDFNISSATSTHTFNLPTASVTNRGLLSSADWTTFNNKQNALTNPVTGTGTSGQVAYFNGTSSLTSESNLFWDATNDRLGIGGTPGAFRLDVSGTARVSTNISIGTKGQFNTFAGQNNVYIGNSSITAGNQGSGGDLYISANYYYNGTIATNVNAGYSTLIGLNPNNDGRTLFYTSGNNAAGVSVALTTTGTIFQTGNWLLGTGTTDAGFRLDVNGTARVQGQTIIKNAADAENIKLENRSIDFSRNGGAYGGSSISSTGNTMSLFSRGAMSFLAGGSGLNIFQLNEEITGVNTGIARISPSIGASSGTAPITTLLLRPTNNFTGTYSGIVRGLLYDPINTSLTGVTHRAIETVTGDVLLATTSGNVAIGTSTLGTATELTLGGSQTASSLIARGGLINTTLVAAANNDVLVGLDINPTFTNGAFTGVTNVGLRVQGTPASTTSPFVQILNNASTVAANQDIVQILTPNVANGVSFQPIRIGTAASGLNSFSIGYTHVSSGSTSNRVNMSFFGQNNLQVFFASGNIAMGGQTTDAGFRLDVNGTARVQGALTTTADASINSVSIGLGGGNIGTNIRVGASALVSNTTGIKNTALGNRALRVSSTNDENTSIGYESFDTLTTGSYNVAIGSLAGRYYTGTNSITSSSSSIFIGYFTKALADSQTNQIVIGTGTTGLGSNTTVLGNSSTTLTALYGAVITGGTSVNASAQLQVDSTTKGFLPPRMTTTQKNAISSPATGLVVYDTTLNKLSVYTGAAWETVTSL